MIATLAVTAARLATLPRTVWQAQEVGFAQALLTFDPTLQQPEMPAYPLYVALGRLVNFFAGDPFRSLVVLSVIASAAAAFLLGRIASSLLGNAWCGAALAAIVLLSPGSLVFGAVPNPESVTLALVAGALLMLIERKPELFAVTAAAAIGVRPQIAPAMLVVVAIGIVALPRRGRTAAMFGAALVLCLGPLVEALGITAALAWLVPEGPLVPMQVDRQSVLRFVAHPWGNKLMALPLLMFALAGVAVSFRRFRTAGALALLSFGAVHVLTSVMLAPSSEGVRPALPATVAAGFFAVAAIARWPAIAALLAGVYAAASFWYAWPVLAERRRADAPAVRAIRAAAARPSTVIADPGLAPFGLLVPAVRIVTPEDADSFRGSTAVLQTLTHGRSMAAGAQTFAWAGSDVYTKLTGEKYRVVSLVPQPASRRYAGRRGVYAQESSPEQGGWRWLSADAEIELPILGFRSATLDLRLPADVPIERNRMQVGASTVEVSRGGWVQVVIPASRSIAIRSEQSFSTTDRRRLAVQLTGVEQR